MANNIFQPTLPAPDVSAAKQVGGIDTSQADMITLAANLGLEAFKGKKKADLRASIQEDVHGFFARGEGEIEGGAPLESQIEEEEAALRNEIDSIALEEGRRRISKLKRLKERGGASSLELKARAETDVKELINDYPGLADEFRSLYNNELNDYASRIALLEKRRKSVFESEADNQKVQDEFLKRVAVHHGIPTTAIQGAAGQKYVTDFQQSKAIENMKTLAANTVEINKNKGTLKLADIEQDAQVTNALDLLNLSVSFNSGNYGGVDVATMLAEGASYDTVATKIFNNDVARQQFTDSAINQIKTQIIKINKLYREGSAHVKGIPQTQVEDSRKASVRALEEMLASIKSDDKQGTGLKTFVGLMQTYEQGAVAGFNIANPTFHLMAKTGLLNRDVISQYTANPELFAKDNPAMFKVLKRAESGALGADVLGEQHTKAFADPEEFDVYRKFNPELADYFIEVSGIGIDKVKIEGFSDDKVEANKQKRWFTSYSKVMLTQIKAESPNSLIAMDNFFFDPNYAEQFKQLNEGQKEELADIISDRSNFVIDSNIFALSQFELGGTKDFNIFFDGTKLRGTSREKRPFFDIFGEGGVRATEIKKFNDNVVRLNKGLKAQWRMELVKGRKVTFEEFVQPTLVKLGLKKESE